MSSASISSSALADDEVKDEDEDNEDQANEAEANEELLDGQHEKDDHVECSTLVLPSLTMAHCLRYDYRAAKNSTPPCHPLTLSTSAAASATATKRAVKRGREAATAESRGPLQRVVKKVQEEDLGEEEVAQLTSAERAAYLPPPPSPQPVLTPTLSATRAPSTVPSPSEPLPSPIAPTHLGIHRHNYSLLHKPKEEHAAGLAPTMVAAALAAAAREAEAEAVTAEAAAVEAAAAAEVAPLDGLPPPASYLNVRLTMVGLNVRLGPTAVSAPRAMLRSGGMGGAGGAGGRAGEAIGIGSAVKILAGPHVSEPATPRPNQRRLPNAPPPGAMPPTPIHSLHKGPAIARASSPFHLSLILPLLPPLAFPHRHTPRAQSPTNRTRGCR